MGTKLAEILEPIAAWFRSLNVPEPIVHWGHPAMMGIVIFVLGSYVAYAGWQGRIAADKDVAIKNRADHRKLAPLMFIFMALGYTGGLLSLVMQKQPIMESPHFWTGSSVLMLLGINGAISLNGFGGNNQGLRNLHAYLGSTAFLVLIIHAILGFRLGISI
jgi:F0F1-type ATP synthase membrane subunit c/vacuolar-type H+-ATPase subunit K